MDILTEGLQKRKTELRTRMDYKNVKPQQKDDYKNVKNSSWKKIFFIPLPNDLLCRKPRQAL